MGLGDIISRSAYWWSEESSQQCGREMGYIQYGADLEHGFCLFFFILVGCEMTLLTGSV